MVTESQTSGKMAPPAVNGTKAVNGAQSSWQTRYDLASKSPHFIGGNRLQKARPSKVKDFVTSADGHSVITSVRSNLCALPEVKVS